MYHLNNEICKGSQIGWIRFPSVEQQKSTIKSNLIDLTKLFRDGLQRVYDSLSERGLVVYLLTVVGSLLALVLMEVLS